MSFSYNMDEYEKLIRRMYPPRVVIDNESCKDATVIQVDNAANNGSLLEVVQILTDLNLKITKAYISSDGDWFMDVFNVTDHHGNKITDEGVLEYIEKSLDQDSCFASSMRRSVGVTTGPDHTSIELIGSDRPGLLSEVCAALTNLNCNVVNAEVWTHNTRVASVIHVTDEESGGAIVDPDRLAMVKRHLFNVLTGSKKSREAKKTVVSCRATHRERRLLQMMFDDKDYERPDEGSSCEKERPGVNVVNWHKDYSVVTLRCKDRPKLLDTVCSSTDMQYVVFHGNVDAEGPEAHQEDRIRHIDGSPVKSDAERQRVIQCLEAALQRRVSEGLKLELCTTDRVGLLSDVTRIFRENSLTVTRAEVSTRAGEAVNTFYVCDSSGYPVDPKIIVIPTGTNKRTYFSNAPPSWQNYTSIFASMDNQPPTNHPACPEVRIDISDVNTDLSIHQSWKEYKEHLKNSQSDDDATKLMSGTFMAVTGQVIGGVMVHRITSSAASSYSWVELATVLGLCVTLAGNSLRGRSRALSALMIKIGAVITASAIVFSMGLHLPPAMALTVGPVMFLIMAVAAAFA